MDPFCLITLGLLCLTVTLSSAVPYVSVMCLTLSALAVCQGAALYQFVQCYKTVYPTLCWICSKIRLVLHYLFLPLFISKRVMIAFSACVGLCVLICVWIVREFLRCQLRFACQCVSFSVSFVFSNSRFWPCLVAFLLDPKLVAAMDGMRWDPTKRVPVLTDLNYHEWSWRICSVFITMGVGAQILFMRQQSEDVVDSEVNHRDGLYRISDGLRAARQELKLKKMQKNLAVGDQAIAQGITDVEAIQGECDDLLAEAVAAYQEELATKAGPFEGMSEKTLTACFRLLTTTISSELDFLVMNFLPHQFEEAWYSVRDYFQSNTRGARMDAKILFFTMTMTKEQRFAEFKNKIEFSARQINSMSHGGKTIISDDDMLTVLMRGLRTNHLDVFGTTLEILEQDSSPLSFVDAYKRLLVVARRSEVAVVPGRSNIDQGMSAGSTSDNVNKSIADCHIFKKHGSCRFGDKCKFTHNSAAAGSARGNHQQSPQSNTHPKCGWCLKGTHSESVCFAKKKAQASARSEEKSGGGQAALAEVREQMKQLQAKLDAQSCNQATEETTEEWAWNAAVTEEVVEDRFVRPSCCTKIMVLLVTLLACLCGFGSGAFPFQQPCHCSVAVPICEKPSPMFSFSNRSIKKRSGHSKIVHNGFPPILQCRLTATNSLGHFKRNSDGTYGTYSHKSSRCQIRHHCCPANSIKGVHDQAALDSGCSSDMFRTNAGFTQLVKCNIPIKVAGGKVIWATHRGVCKRTVLLTSGETSVVTFNNALVVPVLEYDLVSIRRFDEQGMETVTGSGRMVVYSGDKEVLFAILVNGMYRLQAPAVVKESALPAAVLNKVDLLHRRFGHASAKYLTQWLGKKDTCRLSFCDACAIARTHRRPFKHGMAEEKGVATKPLDKVVSDVCGPFRTMSKTGSFYFATIVQ